MRYSDLIKTKKELKIEGAGGGSFTITYNQAFLNRENSALNAGPEMTKIDYVIKCFCDGLLVDWDLMDDKDKKIPIKEKELRKMNMDFLIEIFQVIQDDLGNFFKK